MVFENQLLQKHFYSHVMPKLNILEGSYLKFEINNKIHNYNMYYNILNNHSEQNL